MRSTSALLLFDGCLFPPWLSVSIRKLRHAQPQAIFSVSDLSYALDAQFRQLEARFNHAQARLPPEILNLDYRVDNSRDLSIAASTGVPALSNRIDQLSERFLGDHQSREWS